MCHREQEIALQSMYGCMICSFGIIKKTVNQLIEHLCLWLRYDDPVKLFSLNICHLHQAVVLETQVCLQLDYKKPQHN